MAEILCDGYKPQQIFAMKNHEKLVVTSGNNSVKIIDKCGVVQSEVTKGKGFDPYPYRMS